jgi:DNA-binding NarL/FixJ family response regulator
MGEGHVGEEKAAVIVDQVPIWLDALSRLLGKKGIEVRGCAANVADGTVLVEMHAPDLVMVGLDRAEEEPEIWACVRACRRSTPEARVVVVGSSSEPRLISTAFAAGVAAYCAGTTDGADLEAAIQQSFEHAVFLATSQGAPVSSTPPAELTKREREILQLVAEGYSSAQLARMLWITEQTVKFHLSNIYRKLNVSNRTEASRWAQLHGLLPAVSRRSASIVGA